MTTINPATGDVAAPEPKGKIDAGLLPRDHYKIRLPRWRYKLRQKLLPLVRLETPYLAYIQEHVRTPMWDTYFAFSANLGTHTFFMVMLPLLFWFGCVDLGRGMVHVLAAGVFFSGMLKDLLCLPRPLSPPLHRITMSGSAALEYGFPSTHSTNAVSVALYGLLLLNANPGISGTQRTALQLLAAVYTVSIVFGRIYCGMHGFLDVVVGVVLGAVLALAQWGLHDKIDNLIYGESFWPLVALVIIILVLVRIHPEPADSCPCFDDGVAFAAVVGGAEIGCWHFSKLPFAWHWDWQPAGPGFSYAHLGLWKTVARVLIGVAIIFIWREIAKPTLHTLLPPVYRFFGRIGVSLPRRDFIPASQYKKVPHLPDDTLPSLDELPQLVRSIKRGRSDSVGPQSAADAYETLAYREKRRRDSMDKINRPQSPLRNARSLAGDLEKYENQMGTGEVDMAALGEGIHDEEYEQREVFRKIEPFKPRVRYDVEVVTKLIVYSGIAWWAVEGCPVVFELIGLGMGMQRMEAR